MYAGRIWTAIPYMVVYFGLYLTHLFNPYVVIKWLWALRIVAMLDAGIYTWMKFRKDASFFQPGKMFWIRSGAAVMSGVLVFMSPIWYFSSLFREALKEEFTPKKDTEMLKREVEQYLEKKYGKKFVAEHVSYMPFVESYAIRVHPVDDPELKVGVIDRGTEEGFDDTYREEIWDRQFQKEFMPVLNKHFPDTWRKEISFSANPQKSDLLTGPEIPYYKEILNEDPNFFILHLNLNLYATTPPEEQLSRIWNLFKELEEMGVTRLSVSFEYYKESVKTLDKIDINSVKHLSYAFFLGENDVKSLRTAEDLQKYLKTYR
ncbi:hypothetical protein [Staphylospora marina]|uniref:hypothetical protein n=1 Tax=Staphylospora marina TaxID=2490858 RepID=UPI000F5BB130|nr:hypothetical protein [Staphylospora marina]